MTALIEKGLDIERLPLLESLMSLGNGYIGTRGYLEEFDYDGSIRGNYINGLYERIPMEHAEWAWGFPVESDRMPNLLDLFKITIFLDGEEVLINGDIRDFVRELDYSEGLSRRSYKYKTRKGKIAEIRFEELLSFSRKELRNWTLDIRYDGKIEVTNSIDFKIRNMVSDDPRTASKDIPLVKVLNYSYDLVRGNFVLETIKSNIEVKIDFIDDGLYESSYEYGDEVLNIYYSGQDNLYLNRRSRYWDSIRKVNTDFVSKECLYEEQELYLKNYNENTSIEFLENKELNETIAFMKFHLLQATSQDIYGNISAKGLSGEGYEGHYFWDTEIYMFPVWLLWDSLRAENLLLYRYRLLDYARERAIELGHQKGACFPWRTISGIESSGYFPAGTAQFHINFDIAYIFIQWWLYNNDMDFLVSYGIEVLLETARTALEIGAFQNDGFHIHSVTGPDEYTALVSDNYYTNKMAQYNLLWAVKLWRKIEKDRPDDYKKIQYKLNIKEEEILDMEKAAEEMVFIYDDEKEILAQDSTFLSKKKWPKSNELRPLLLNYHPLTIYRHQILKQADTVLALYLINDINDELTRKTFYYYNDITSHDSSLSKCISGIMATRLKDSKLAYRMFLDSLYLDLNDLNNNTSDGLHMANIGGTLTSILKGFVGLEIYEDGLHINPFLPKELGRLKVRFTYKGTLIEVYVEEEDIKFRKISGPNTEIIVKGEKIMVEDRAVLFDLDGVLTSTSDNHYEAWKKLMKEKGFNLPEEFRDKLRGISRMDSLELILDYFNVNYTNEEKSRMADLKNKYYNESIESFTPGDLYPGVMDLLDKLKNMDVKIGLVSASKNAVNLVGKLGIKDYFDIIVDPEKLKRGKPYPDPFLEGAKKLGVSPRACLGIEDAASGIESINSAGMTSLGIGVDKLSGADFRYETIEDASGFIIDWVVENHGGN